MPASIGLCTGNSRCRESPWVLETHCGAEYCRHAKAIIERVVYLVLFFCCNMCMCIASGVADRSFHLQYDSYCVPPSSSPGATTGTIPAASTAQMDLATHSHMKAVDWAHSVAE